MPVDKAELAKDLETPEYQQIVRETLAQREFVIRTKEEDTTFQANLKQDVIEREIPSRIKAVHDMYDKDIRDTTGIERDQNEKTFDYLKRVLKSENADALKTKIQELETRIAEGDKTGATARALEDAEKKYKDAIALKDKEIQSLMSQASEDKKVNMIASEYAGIKSSFKADKPRMFERTEKAILEDARRLSKIGEDGKLYITDEAGNIKKDAQFNPITVGDYLKKEFADIIDDGSGKKGSGSKPGEMENVEDPNTITVDNFTYPESVKTGGDLLDYMLNLGIKRGTKQFNELWAKFRPLMSDGDRFRK